MSVLQRPLQSFVYSFKRFKPRPINYVQFSKKRHLTYIQHHSSIEDLVKQLAKRLTMDASGDMKRPSVIFVLGGPGAGKGTQCANIVDKYGYVHLSAGDLLRAERKNPESEAGQLIEDCIVNGKIVPVAITCQLLENAIFEHVKQEGKINFLVDGFPRNQDNLDGWNTQMGEKVSVKGVFFFDCTEETCTARLLDRGKSSGRSDDNIESIKKRFHTYVNSSMPIINHFKAKDQCKTFDASKSREEVFSDVIAVFDSGM